MKPQVVLLLGLFLLQIKSKELTAEYRDFLQYGDNSPPILGHPDFETPYAILGSDEILLGVVNTYLGGDGLPKRTGLNSLNVRQFQSKCRLLTFFSYSISFKIGIPTTLSRMSEFPKK